MPLTGRSLLLSLILALTVPAVGADTIALAPDHPERYTVVKGDTLWDISARFLRDPWRWPNVWNKNEQIKNPHLIYPGDVIVLSIVNGQPELSVVRREKLSPDGGGTIPAAQTETSTSRVSSDVRLGPQVRAEPIASAIPTLKPDVIAPFLTQPLAVGRNELEKAGYVAIGLDDRVALGTLSQFYARGLGKNPSERYQIFRKGKALKHPDTKELLAYEATYLGEAQLLEPGDPAKLEVVSVKQEIVPTDRLLAAPPERPLPYYYPHAPAKQVNGRILSALNAVAEFGPGTIVSLSLGRREGMEEGHVLRIMRHAGTRRDPVTHRRFKLPDEESGLLIVFRTYEKVSYALVVNANKPIHIHDAVRTP